MASQTRGRRDRRDTEVGLCNCVAAVFQVLVALESITFISGQGHLNPNTEFRTRKTFEEVSLFPKQQPYGVTSETQNLKQNLVSQINSQIGVIRFEPPFLDFDTECVGMPKLRTVYIHNPHKEYDLQLSSISARTSHFHASFFDRKIVPPGGNTSFEVVFLARVVGNVENTLFINTVYGAHAYQVFGIGIPNPYRLRPYLGAKVPLNSTFSPLISMHNPTSETLQVTEMYSSSGYLQLQLPQGQHEVDKEQWAIPPYETREVIRARFMGQVEANHTAFIRIKTEKTEYSESDFHILPVEVEVSSAPGIYSALELLDFGILRTRYDEPKSLPLFLLNSGNLEVQISSISLAVPNPAVEIAFSKAKLRPSLTMFTLVANVTFSAYLARSEVDQKGIIIVKPKEKSYRSLEIPFFVNLLEGTLGYDQQGVLFHFDKTKTSKEVKLSNLFKFPVVLQNLTLPAKAKKIFKVLNFSGHVTLPVSLQKSPFSIEYNPSKQLAVKLSQDATEEEPCLVHHLTLHTNASKFSLPLYIFSGKISYKVLREDKRKIDFGIMGTNDERQVLFAIYNHNPTKILLDKIESALKNIEIRLVSLTEEDSGKNLTYEDDTQLKNFWLPTNSCSVFEVTLTATDIEEDIVNSIKILTQYQEIIIPVLAKIVIGTLTVKPEKVKFAKSFPGRVVHQTLTVVNTFAQSTKLEYVHAEQVDKRFYYKKLKNQGLKLEPNKQAKIGKVYFDARLGCKPDRCYSGLPTSTTVGHHWLTTLALGADSVEFDTKRYNEHRRRWWNVQNKGLTGPNTTLVLSADVVMNVKVPVQASLYWPSLLKEDSFEFQLTHVGRKSTGTLRLYNPADSPVIVQVLTLSLYPQPEAVMSTLGWEDKLDDESFIINNRSVFHLLDPRRDSVKDSMSAQMVWLEYTLNGKLNRSVVNLFLEAGDKIDLNIEFSPYDDRLKSTVLLLRNNLTILDAIPLYGRGAYEHLTLGGRAPNLKSSVLRFKLTKELLKDCTRKKTNPSFTVRKWFHANNTGDLPIHITSMTVSGSPCEGYGFRVLDCDQFILQPNTSKKIEIAYTPDFTSYLVLHKLRLVTSQGNEMLFTLNVTLPPHMLPLCQEAIPRPSWEPTLYHFIVSVILVLVVGVLLMGYIESVNIWESFVRVHRDDFQQKLSARPKSHSSPPPGFEKPFDLRDIGKNYSSASTIGAGDEQFTCDPKRSSPVAPKPSRKCSNFLDDLRHYPTQTSLKSNRFMSKLFSFFRRAQKTQARKSSCSDDAHVDKTATSPNNEVPTLNTLNGPRLCNTAASIDRRKNDRKFHTLDHVVSANSNTRYTKPTAEIRPVSKISEVSKGKNSINDSFEKLNSKECLMAKTKDESVERQSESDESVTRNTIKTKAVERRRSHSKSSQRSRESTSSSESLYTPEPIVLDEPCLSQTPEIQRSETDESKPTRSRKLKKLSRKQLKALAREKESQNKENELKVQSEKPYIPDFTTNNLPNLEKKPCQPKHRSDSLEPVDPRYPASVAKPLKKSIVSDYQSPRLPSSRNKESKIVVKRRTYSYSTDNNSRSKGKPGKLSQVSICKRPSPPSSSSHDISESSSGESSALWDTPCNARDADEDMRQIAEQSQQAELMIGTQQHKERKRGKGATSPANLTSGSRSSSYSSVRSSGSNDSNPPKPSILGVTNQPFPSKKLSRSQSDTSGGTPTTAFLRKRNPRPAVDSSNNSPTRTLQPDVRNRSPPLQQNQYSRSSRAMSSPSMFVNSFGGRKSGLGSPGQEHDAQWTSPGQIVAPSYSAFGDSNFNLVGDLISNRRRNTSLTATWESPFSANSSLYSTPTPPRTQNRSPPDITPPLYPPQWNSARSPVPLHSGYAQYDAPPGTPTTPGVSSAPPNWGEVPASTGNNMTTHGIWSVSNAVTMDENRSADESDPLGVRSIWSNTPNIQLWRNPR